MNKIRVRNYQYIINSYDVSNICINTHKIYTRIYCDYLTLQLVSDQPSDLLIFRFMI